MHGSFTLASKVELLNVPGGDGEGYERGIPHCAFRAHVHFSDDRGIGRKPNTGVENWGVPAGGKKGGHGTKVRLDIQGESHQPDRFIHKTSNAACTFLKATWSLT